MYVDGESGVGKSQIVKAIHFTMRVWDRERESIIVRLRERLQHKFCDSQDTEVASSESMDLHMTAFQRSERRSHSQDMND